MCGTTHLPMDRTVALHVGVIITPPHCDGDCTVLPCIKEIRLHKINDLIIISSSDKKKPMRYQSLAISIHIQVPTKLEERKDK